MKEDENLERDGRVFAAEGPEILRAFREGEIGLEAALARLEGTVSKEKVFGRSSDAVPDLSRAARIGFPEVIYGQGKEPATVAAIAGEILSVSDRLLVTRADDRQFEAVAAVCPTARRHAEARMISVGLDLRRKSGKVGVLCAGTTDIPVAEEAAITAEMWGAEVLRFFDIGVAGLHRLLSRLDAVRRCRALVVVAGMEGALPSVVGGLVAAPIIACPTSVGYGANFGGLAALLAMLNSCAPGISVVNIDNGFGAGFAAGRINAMIESETDGAETGTR